jgi:uncharacterized protein YcfL
MNRPALAAILFASIAVAGCAGNKVAERPSSAYGCPIGEKTIGSKAQLIKSKLEVAGSLPNIEVADLRCADRDGLMRIDVDLKNEGSDARRIAYRFRWLDKDGMRAWDDETWKPVLVYGNTLYTVTTMAPSQDAADFRVVIVNQDDK